MLLNNDCFLELLKYTDPFTVCKASRTNRSVKNLIDLHHCLLPQLRIEIGIHLDLETKTLEYSIRENHTLHKVLNAGCVEPLKFDLETIQAECRYAKVDMIIIIIYGNRTERALITRIFEEASKCKASNSYVMWKNEGYTRLHFQGFRSEKLRYLLELYLRTCSTDIADNNNKLNVTAEQCELLCQAVEGAHVILEIGELSNLLSEVFLLMRKTIKTVELAPSTTGYLCAHFNTEHVEDFESEYAEFVEKLKNDLTIKELQQNYRNRVDRLTLKDGMTHIYLHRESNGSIAFSCVKK